MKPKKTIRLIIYELIKLGICFIAFYFYNPIPLTVFVIALPVDIFSYLIFKKRKWRFKKWVYISIFLYMTIFFADYGWFESGHQDPFSFLLSCING